MGKTHANIFFRCMTCRIYFVTVTLTDTEFAFEDLSIAVVVIVCVPFATEFAFTLVEQLVAFVHVFITEPSNFSVIDAIPLASAALAETVTVPFAGRTELFCGAVIVTVGGVTSASRTV